MYSIILNTKLSLDQRKMVFTVGGACVRVKMKQETTILEKPW